ncbi:unnamed protein product [Symbiodinium natans]|uniref:Uncharacterized protein n=1 Tax=Symbiodinium natans TaxID=878477 RepID=A0A812NRU9_9DINO|nr:unnamed protein product [Symbiodinium natans]
MTLIWRSQSLPSWGFLMNLVGEEPSPFLKRLPAGVYGATALLFLRELTILSSTSHPEDLGRLPTQQHLCPAKAGFWAAFLIPGARGLSDEAAAFALVALAGADPPEVCKVIHSAAGRLSVAARALPIAISWPMKKIKKSPVLKKKKVAKTAAAETPKEEQKAADASPKGSPPTKVQPKAKAKTPKAQKEPVEKQEKKDEKKELLALQAVKEILKAIADPDAQKHGTFILPDWHTTYKDQLGSYKKFVKRSAQLQVIEMDEGKYIIQKAGDTTAPAVPQAKAKAAKGDWKQLLQNAWNIYCQATARHEWNIDVFTSALARGVRTTKPLTGTAGASPKLGPKASPNEPTNDGAEAEVGAKKSKAPPKKGVARKAEGQVPKVADKRPRKKVKNAMQK